MEASRKDLSKPDQGRGVYDFYLAPMEGVTDFWMREALTEFGQYRAAFTEFLRVSAGPLPKKAILHRLPEAIRQGCKTKSGVPVYLQILGGNPEFVAETAAVAVDLGVPGIDLNFGCPAPVVNRSDGGAALLKDLPRMQRIIEAVRRVVPEKTVRFSVKMRLGWDQIETCLEAGKRAEDAGADAITLHGRTRMQSYGPPVRWDMIERLSKTVQIPVIANGDLWSFEDVLECQKITGLQQFMIARGALAQPNLTKGFMRESVLNFYYLKRFVEITEESGVSHDFILKKLKQWGQYGVRGHRLPYFDRLKTLQSVNAFIKTYEECFFEPHSG